MSADIGDADAVNTDAAAKPVDHAGVRMPPPLIYVVIFGLGLLLNLAAPLVMPPTVPARILGLIFLAVGVPLLIASNLLFRRTHTSLVPVKPSATLVMRGPYQLTRNPMYLGLLCVYIGVACWFGTVWPLIFSPLVVLTVQHTVIAKEERYLERRFGNTYSQYRTQVRRWL